MNSVQGEQCFLLGGNQQCCQSGRGCQDAMKPEGRSAGQVCGGQLPCGSEED